jgi:hypothetical protein
MKTLLDTALVVRITSGIAVAVTLFAACAGESPVELDGPAPLKDRSCFDFTDYLHTVSLQELSGTAYAVAVRGSLAYVAVGNSGLQVVDVGIASAPKFMGSVGATGTAWDVDVADSVVCVAFGSSGLVVVDAGDPVRPIIVGRALTPGQARGVAVSGTVAYVADDVVGLMLFDLTDPRAPRPMGVENSAGRAVDVAVSGTLVYVADELVGLRVVNASDPWSPWLANVVSMPAAARGVAVADGFAYVATSEAGLQTVDISTLGAEAIVDSLGTPGVANAVALDGSTVFVAAGRAGTMVIDVSTPVLPDFVTHIAAGVSANGVAYQDGFLYVAEGSDGLRVVNAANPLPPPVLGSLVPTDEEAVTHVAAETATAFAVGTTTGLFGARLQNSILTLAGSAPLASADVTDVVVRDGFVYLAAGMNGIHIFDISSPGVVTHAGNVPYTGNVDALAVEDSLVYFVAGGPTFGVYRSGATAATTLQVRGGDGAALGVNGNVVYVLNTNRQTHVINVTDPDAPFVSNVRHLEGSGVEVLQDETYAYFITSRLYPGAVSGVAVYDVQLPVSPQPIAFLRITDGIDYIPVDAALSGDVLYVALRRGGVRVFDVSDPTNPVRMGSIATTGATMGVAAAAGVVFIADDVGGLITVPADECAPSP